MDVDGRDPERAPLAWQAPSAAGPGCGFTTGRPWLPFAPDAERSNVAAQAADPDSTLSLYRRLIWLRRRSAALQGGRELLLEPDGDDVLAYLREAPGERLAVALNFSPEEVAVDTGLSGHGRIEVSTDPARRPGELRIDRLVLRPDEGVLITLEP